MTHSGSLRRPSTLVGWSLAFAVLAATSVPAQTAARVETLAQVDGGTGGITIDGQGNILSSDFGAVLSDPTTAGTKVFRITPKGEVSVLTDGFEGASGSGMDAAGNLYQANIRGGSISKVSTDGTVTPYATEGLTQPVGVEVAPDGTLFVANCGSASIQKIAPDGTSSMLVQSRILKCPNGITLAGDGNLYVSNFVDGSVVQIAMDGSASVFATLPGGGNGHLVFAHDALWVVARKAHQIYRLTLDGEFTLVAGSGEQGGQDGAPNEASFSFPNDLGWSPDGTTLYVNEVADPTSKGNILAPTRIRAITFAPPAAD